MCVVCRPRSPNIFPNLHSFSTLVEKFLSSSVFPFSTKKILYSSYLSCVLPQLSSSSSHSVIKPSIFLFSFPTLYLVLILNQL